MKIIREQALHQLPEQPDIGQSNWDAPDHLALGQIAVSSLWRTVALEPGENTAALPLAPQELSVEALTFADPLMPGRQITGEQLLNRRVFNDALLVLHRGSVVHESYRNGMQALDRHVIHSCTKSLCAMLTARALQEGRLSSVEEVCHYLPAFAAQPAWQGVSVQHLLDMRAGIAYSEDYTDPNADYWRYARAAGYYPPLAGEQAVGAEAWVSANLIHRSHAPGSVFCYNSCLTIVLGMMLAAVYQQPLASLFESHFYRHLGASGDAWLNCDSQGFPIVEGQLNLHLRDFARCVYPMVNEGKTLHGEPLISPAFIEQTVTPDPALQRAYQAHSPDPVFSRGQYRNKFWVVDPDAGQFTMLGIHGQFAWFDLPRQLMMVGFGSYPRQDGTLMMRSLNTLWQGVAQQFEP